jgi:hypothetical protein
MEFGSYTYDKSVIDTEKHKQAFNNILSGPQDGFKRTGGNNLNAFVKVPEQDTLSKYAREVTGLSDSSWYWEYFHSAEPVGLHTDAKTDYFPKSERDKPEPNYTHLDRTVVGIIIPLEWNCKQPYTINYNRTHDDDLPRKMIYRKGQMRYIDTDEVFMYRDPDEQEWKFDKEVLKYNPLNSGYVDMYAGLRVHSVYTWTTNTMMIFDTRRWHSSSWFLSTEHIPESIALSTEYKRSIVGFGSVSQSLT